MSYKYNFGSTIIEKDEKMKLNTSLGFTGYVGFSIPIHAQLALFVEGKSSLGTYYLQRLEVTKYVVDGKDQLAALTIRDKVTVYEENKNYRETPVNDPNKPRTGGPPYPVVASNVSITAGIMISL